MKSSTAGLKVILKALRGNSLFDEYGITHIGLNGGHNDTVTVVGMMAGMQLNHAASLAAPLDKVIESLEIGLITEAHNTAVRLGYRSGARPFHQMSSQARNPTMILTHPAYQTVIWHARMMGQSRDLPVEIDVAVDAKGRLIASNPPYGTVTIQEPPDGPAALDEALQSIRDNLFPAEWR